MSETPALSQLQFAAFLRYYKRREVQDAIVRHAANREVSPRYGEGFGKRPDVLAYPSDVLEFAKRKCTSFHASEERWDNPLNVKTGMSRKEADAMRIGWDLVLDIDAKDWGISRLTALLFVQALRAHGITSISVKFSGNKGWHVGVPFEAFPPVLFDGERELVTKDLFPDLPRAIAAYLIGYIGDAKNGLVLVDGTSITFAGKVKDSLDRFAKDAGKSREDLLERWCPACAKTVERNESYGLACPNPACGHRPERRFSREERAVLDDADRVCPKCKRLMDVHLLSRAACSHDPRTHHTRFRIAEVVAVDTVLLASRHLYRMAYSLHEKSGLVSVPIDPDSVLQFRKEDARPDAVPFDRTFLDPATAIPGEGTALAQAAWAAAQAVERKRSMALRPAEEDIPAEAIPEEMFPPCMRRILEGLADGKKRAMFALTNFLLLAGWSPEMIEARLFEWNRHNPEPLRETVITGHVRSLKAKRDRFPPPSCRSFYQELRVCQPDDLCALIKNPVQYAKKKSAFGAPKKRAKKSSPSAVTRDRDAV